MTNSSYSWDHLCVRDPVLISWQAIEDNLAAWCNAIMVGKNTKRSTIELSTKVEWRDISELGKYDSCCKLRVLDLVETRKPCLSELDYIQLATADLEGARPSANTDLPSIHGAPPCEHNVWGDGWTLGLVQCRATHANVDRAAAASVPLEPYNSHIADGYEVGVLFDIPHSASRFVGKRCTQPFG